MSLNEILADPGLSNWLKTPSKPNSPIGRRWFNRKSPDDKVTEGNYKGDPTEFICHC
jgi:hypothetical protein